MSVDQWACARTDKAIVHSQYLHRLLLDLDKILNPALWQPIE